MHKHRVVLLLGLMAGCDGEVSSRETDVVTTAAYGVYEAVAPELRALVEQSWGTPAARKVAGRTTLRFDQSLTSDTLPDQILGHLDDAWAESVLKRGLVESLCVSAPPEQWCVPGGHTMVVQLSPVTFATPDSARVQVAMYNLAPFTSTWEVIVVRRARQPWKVVTKQMLTIS